jgi:hypothetical protein
MSRLYNLLLKQNDPVDWVVSRSFIISGYFGQEFLLSALNQPLTQHLSY